MNLKEELKDISSQDWDYGHTQLDFLYMIFENQKTIAKAMLKFIEDNEAATAEFFKNQSEEEQETMNSIIESQYSIDKLLNSLT